MNFDPIYQNEITTNNNRRISSSFNKEISERDISESKIHGIEENQIYIETPIRNDDNQSQRPVILKKKSNSILRRASNVSSKIVLFVRNNNIKGKKTLNISLLLLGILGFILLTIFIVVSIRGGWSQADLHDLNSQCRNAIFLLSFFLIFISIIGLCGTNTLWKPIILTITLFTSMAFLGQIYVAKTVLDSSRFAERNMAIVWWEKYTNDVIIQLEEQYSCCGYLDHNDKGIVSANCPTELVTYVVPDDVKSVPAEVKKNDSYKKKFGSPSDYKDTTNTEVGDYDPTKTPTTENTSGEIVNTNQPIDNANDNTNTIDTVDNTGNGDTDNTDNTGYTDNTDTTNQQEFKKKRMITIQNINEDDDNDDTMEEKNIIKNSLEIGLKTNKIKIRKSYIGNENITQINQNHSNNNNNNNSNSNNINSSIKLKSRQEETVNNDSTTTESGSTVVGCRDQICNKIKSGVRPLYIFNFISLILYVVVICASIQFWLELRKEIEYDEFS